MKPEDTVMSRKDLNLIMIRTQDLKYPASLIILAQKQAEISFKAGQEEEYKKWVKACMKAGMLISQLEQLIKLKLGIKQQGNPVGFVDEH